MEKASWESLDDRLRRELEAMLQQPTSAFHSDYYDAVAWWLLLTLVCVGGAGAAVWDMSTDGITLAERLSYYAEEPLTSLLYAWRSPSLLGLLAALVVGPWVAITWARNHQRRGYAALSTAMVRVKGRKLLVLPYSDVAGAKTLVIGKRGKRFTVLTLTLKDGQKVEWFVSGGWAKEVTSRLAPGVYAT